MEEKYIKLLEKLAENIEKLKKTKTPDSYWKKEAKVRKKLNEENERIEKSIRMSSETFRRPFDL